MSCIAGVGGNVKKLVKLAKSGRKLIVVDGCSLACSKACLANHELKPHLHFDLSRFGVPKSNGQDFDETQMLEVLEQIKKSIQSQTSSESGHAPEDHVDTGKRIHSSASAERKQSKSTYFTSDLVEKKGFSIF
jgi:hypothetical protein